MLCRLSFRPAALPPTARPAPASRAPLPPPDADQAEVQVVKMAEMLLVLLDGGISLVGVLEVVGGEWCRSSM